MGNQSLNRAKAAPNDEYYTQLDAIQTEMNAYLELDEDLFRGKSVLLPCDDPEWSNFTKYFATRFEALGLKRLTSTSYAHSEKQAVNINVFQPTLFEIESEGFDPDKTQTRGKVFLLDKDANGDKRINIDDLEWEYLEGSGDYRSVEVSKLRDEADFIITNPPFTLFQDFMEWVIKSGKKFVVIGPASALFSKVIFDEIRANRLWLGKGFSSGNAFFKTPTPSEYASGVFDEGTGLVKFRNVKWITNVDHGLRREPMKLETMEKNRRFVTGSKFPEAYEEYDNFNAIEVPLVKAIPSDYDGLMGVPGGFLDKYNPDQFEIVGISDKWGIDPSYRKVGAFKYDRPYLNGQRMYPRVFIKHRKG
jgi:hypothetical protein